MLDEDRCGVVVDLVAGPAKACRVGGLGGAYLADELAGPGCGEDGENVLPVAEPEWVYCPGGAVGEQRCRCTCWRGTSPVMAWATMAGSAAASQ